jgi:hypothetical protein
VRYRRKTAGKERKEQVEQKSTQDVKLTFQGTTKHPTSQPTPAHSADIQQIPGIKNWSFLEEESVEAYILTALSGSIIVLLRAKVNPNFR